MKLFNCIIDDGESVFRSFLAANSKKELLEVYGGNGRFEKIVDVTDEYLIDQSVNKLIDDLRKAEWGKAEIAIIAALVSEHIKDRDEKIRKEFLKCGPKKRI